MERCIENAESHCKSYPRCYGCNAFRKPTNADRIRAMSDEELAEMLLSACVYREFCHGCIAEKDMPNCPGEILGKWEEWLQQPAEGE